VWGGGDGGKEHDSFASSLRDFTFYMVGIVVAMLR
jgi:hypothetical protein